MEKLNTRYILTWNIERHTGGIIEIIFKWNYPMPDNDMY